MNKIAYKNQSLSMKPNLKLLLLLLTSAAFTYTACKKSNDTPVSKTVGADVVSSQVALNIAQSLSGSYGGVNINNGIKSPGFVTNKNSGHAINSMNSLCGFLTDSVLNYNTNIGDTIKSQTHGRLKFYFNCLNGNLTGFTANDSLKTTGTAPKYSFIYDVIQNYDIKGLNSNNTLLSVNGTLKSFVNLTYNQAGIKPTSVNTAYVLTGLTVDLTKNGDITGGTATFVSTGSNNYGVWNYTGSIVFLGDHKANIIINGKTYHADLITGKITS